MDTTSAKKRIAKDTLLYLPAKVIEGIVGILTITFYTMYFTPSVYGYYSLVNTTVNILSLLFMGWLIQSGFRYVNIFSSEKKLKLFYSTVFSAWTIINIIVLAMGLITLYFTKSLIDPELKQMVLFGLFMYITYNTAQVLFSLLGALRKIKLNLILSMFSVTAKLLVTSIFIYYFKYSTQTAISAIISNICIDGFVSLIIILRLKLYKYINPAFFSKKVFKKFLGYGVPIVGVSITMSLLNLSDRYVIIFSLGKTIGSVQAGIYAANYSIASAVFSMILLAVMRGVYPMILKTWRQNNIEQTQELLSQAVRYFLIISLPAAVGLSVLSKPIVTLFIDSDYVGGHFVIVCVSFGMMFLGLTEYCNKAWELTSNTKPILRNSLISGVINVTSNIIFVPIFGYMAAAVNTTLSYLIYFVLSFYGSRKLLKWHLPAISYLRIIGSSALMGIILFVIISYVNITSIMLIISVFLGGTIYIGSLYFSKEINNEVIQIRAWLTRKKSNT